MVIAMVYETLAFLFPDLLFYVYGLLGYGTGHLGATSGFHAAALVDLAYVPVAFAIIRGAVRAFKKLGFE